MSLRHASLLLATVPALLLSCSVVLAEALPPELREQDAVAQALARSRERALHEAEVAQRRRLYAAGAPLPGPELRLGGISSRNTGAPLEQLEVGLRWRLPELGESAVRLLDLELDLQEQKAAAQEFRGKLASRVRQSFAALLALEQLRRLYTTRVELAEQRAELLKSMLALGRTTVLRQARAELAASRFRAELRRAEEGANQARLRLEQELGRPGPWSLVEEPLPELALSWEQLRERAVRQRAEVALEQSRRALLEARLEQSRLRPYPWPTFVETRYHREAERESWGELLLGLQLPLFDWVRGRPAPTDTDLQLLGDRERTLPRELEQELLDRHAGYREALSAWQQEREEAGRQRGLLEELTRKAAQHEALAPVELLELKLLGLQSEEQLCRSRLELACALAELYEALGEEHPAGAASGEGDHVEEKPR